MESRNTNLAYFVWSKQVNKKVACTFDRYKVFDLLLSEKGSDYNVDSLLPDDSYSINDVNVISSDVKGTVHKGIVAIDVYDKHRNASFVVERSFVCDVNDYKTLRVGTKTQQDKDNDIFKHDCYYQLIEDMLFFKLKGINYERN